MVPASRLGMGTDDNEERLTMSQETLVRHGSWFHRFVRERKCTAAKLSGIWCPYILYEESSEVFSMQEFDLEMHEDEKKRPFTGFFQKRGLHDLEQGRPSSEVRR